MSSKDEALRDITVTANNSSSWPSFLPRPSPDEQESSQTTNENTPLSIPSISPRPCYMMPTSASRSQNEPESHSRNKHLTPKSLDSSTNKRKPSASWMASASKRLGLSNSKTRKSTGVYPRFQQSSPTLRRPDIPSQIPVKRPIAISSPRSSPTPYRAPAPDKPLPSLPVATILPGSPVHRRSIIDATERPLVRRSLSPQLGDEETEEWPALSPFRPESGADKRQQTAIIPSVGESVLEGIRHLNIQDDHQTERRDSSVSTEAPDSNRQPFRDAILQPRCGTPSSLDSPETSVHPASSAESLAPKTTTLKDSCSKPAPNVRHTKTSAMRMRLSGGSMDGNDLKYEHKDKANSSPQRALSGNKSLRNEKIRRHGPVRSTSRSRHTATSRGSPYLIPSQSKVKLIEIKRKPVATPDANCARPGARSGSTDSNEDFRRSQLIAVKGVKRTVSGKRSASIPLPSRLIRRYPGDENEGDVDAPQLRQTSETNDQLGNESQDADIDIEQEPKRSRSDNQQNGHGHSSQPAKQLSNLLSFSELMTTPPPDLDESHFSSDSDDKSIRGYDEDGGFKIKKLRSNGKNAATLRISDDAHHLLSPDHDDSTDDSEEPGLQTKRSSITDLRQAVVIKEHLRRSGELIKSQVQLTRSITERSLARLSGASSQDGDARSESEYSVPENGGIGQEVQSSHVEVPAESISTKDIASTPRAAEDGEDIDGNHVDTPSSAGQGDWPFKDFKTFASSTPATTEASLSPWIPPPNWDVNMPQGDTTVMSEDGVSPFPPVPRDKPATDANHTLEKSRSSEQVNDNHDRVPTPTPKHFSRPSSRASSTDPVKRPFPPRTTSKQSVPQKSTSRVLSNLSPVKESPDRITGLRQPRKSYGKDLPMMPEPKHVKSFSESIEDINQSLEAVRPTSSASRAAAPATSGKRAMSTLRGLFHKKSYEFRAGSRRGKKSAAEATPKSSPLLATPIPFPKPLSSLHRGFSPLHFDAVTPVRSKSVAQRKPTPAANNPTSAPTLQNSSMEPPEIRLATQTALKLLDLARDERPGVRQNLLVELGKATIEVVDAARDAEKALEQAKQAAAKAEIQALTSKKAVAEVAGLIEKLLSVSD